MITRVQLQAAQERAARMLASIGINITATERQNIEVAEFGLGELEQTCTEHRHPPSAGNPGKMETFCCRWGCVVLFIKGDQTQYLQCKPPVGSEAYYTVFHEIAVSPGDQYTIPPDTLHWFQAGPEGAIVSEFSSASHDESDVFTDPGIRRIPEISD